MVAVVGLRVQLLEPLGDPVHRRLGLLAGDPVLEASDALEVVHAARHLGRVEGQRDPQVAVRFGEPEVRRHHADHRVVDGVEGDRVPDHVRGAAEEIQPDPVAEDGDALGAGTVLLLGEGASEERLDTEDAPGRRVALDRGDPLGPVAAGEVAPAVVPGRQVLEDLVLLAPVDEVRVGEAGPIPALGAREELVELVRVRVWQEVAQVAVDRAEDLSVGADREGQRHDRREREDRAADQRAQGVQQVLAQPLQGTLHQAAPTVAPSSTTWPSKSWTTRLACRV